MFLSFDLSKTFDGEPRKSAVQHTGHPAMQADCIRLFQVFPLLSSTHLHWVLYPVWALLSVPWIYPNSKRMREDEPPQLTFGYISWWWAADLSRVYLTCNLKAVGIERSRGWMDGWMWRFIPCWKLQTKWYPEVSCRFLSACLWDTHL